MKRRIGGGLALVAIAALATGVYSRTAASSEGSNAQTLPNLNPGEGWQEQETAPVKGLQARAWSDPAAGCHLALFEVPVSDSVGV
mgnify:CR=1 FL=1